MTRIVHGCESPFLGGFTELRYHGFRQMCRQKGRNEDEAKQKEALVDGNLVPAGIPAVDGADQKR